MSTHAVPAGTHPAPDQCTWEHYSHGVALDCDERAIPGGVECATHLIARVQAEHPEDVSHWCSFGPFPVEIPEVTA